MKSCLLLLGGSICLLAVLLGPGWLLQGPEALGQSLTALALSLGPAMASLAWVMAAKKTPELQLTAILGGTGLRLAAAAGGALVLHQAFPETLPMAFFLWVGAFYVGTLALETTLALRVYAAAGRNESSMAARVESTGSLTQAR